MHQSAKPRICAIKVHYQARFQRRKSPKREILPPPPFSETQKSQKKLKKKKSCRKGDYTLCSHNVSQTIRIFHILERNILKTKGGKSGMILLSARPQYVQKWNSISERPGRSLGPDIMGLDPMKRSILCGTVLQGEMIKSLIQLEIAWGAISPRLDFRRETMRRDLPRLRSDVLEK